MRVELEGVGYTYLPNSEAAAQALADISLVVEPGEFIALVGPTGSGKSTLAQVMAGLLKPVSGRIAFDGEDLWTDASRLPRLRRRVGLVFQEPEKQLFEMTVEEDIAFWPRNAGIAPGEIEVMVEEAMSAVGLEPAAYRGRSPFTLSGGEMRRAAIAGILVMGPPVLILDEPAVGLDPKGRSELLANIKALNERGTTVIMISHDMDEVAECARRVLMLAQGKIVFDGAPRDAFKQAELLSGLGLDLPEMARLASLLNRRGWPGTRLPLTLGEAERDILAVLGRVAR